MTPLKIILGCLLFDMLQLFFWIESTDFGRVQDSKSAQNPQAKTQTHAQAH